MTDTPSNTGTGGVMDPPGGHSREALEDAARKMHLEEEAGEPVLDPPGGHDPQALQDAAEKFGAEE